MNIEEKPFKTLYIVEIASNSNNNKIRKIISNLANKKNIISHKINKGSPKKRYTNMKSFTKEKKGMKTTRKHINTRKKMSQT